MRLDAPWLAVLGDWREERGLAQRPLWLLRVGWFRRDPLDPSDPDEYEVVWSSVYRGEYQTRLGEVWAKGPTAAKNWT